MKIQNLRSERKDNLNRVAATVIWEERKRLPQDIYIETTDEFAQDLSPNANAFLIACTMPAMYYQEKRIWIDGEICPELKEGLITSMAWMRHWFGYGNQIIPIEAKIQSSSPMLPIQDRTGSFFTGGIDSWANLRSNRLNFPLEHPGSIKDCLIVYGLQNISLDKFEEAVNSFSKIAQDAQVNFIPVYTNIYSHLMDLDPDYLFWMKAYNGAALAAIAHAFAKRFTVISIASSHDIPGLVPLGTHPALDHNYSSYNLKIRHDGVTLSRLAKTKLVVDWDIAFQNLRVCDQFDIPPERLNCGQCEKCIRTMTTLVALDVLEKTNAFPYTDVSRKLLSKAIYIKNKGIERIYRELISLLTSRGRNDLVCVIKENIWKTNIKRFDSKFFKGILFSSIHKVKSLINHRSRTRLYSHYK